MQIDFFHSLEVVDRVSETQLQVGENSKWGSFKSYSGIISDTPLNNLVLPRLARAPSLDVRIGLHIRDIVTSEDDPCTEGLKTHCNGHRLITLTFK